jgi:nitrogen fixation NifU-like protein
MNPRFLDHFQNPRHVGRLSEPTAEVEVSNPVCGDELTLGVRVEAQRLAEVAFRVRGCSGAIAAASALCELIAGKSVSGARAVDREVVDQALGGLPTLKRHGADLAAEGLQRALAVIAEQETHEH